MRPNIAHLCPSQDAFQPEKTQVRAWSSLALYEERAKVAALNPVLAEHLEPVRP